MTGFSQSSTAAISRWLPYLSVRAIDPGPGVGAAAPSRPDGAERSAPEQKCLPSPRPTPPRHGHRRRRFTQFQEVDHLVALRRGKEFAAGRPVQRDPGNPIPARIDDVGTHVGSPGRPEWMAIPFDEL